MVRIDINKSIARNVYFGHSLYINETIPVAIRPRVRAKALPGEFAGLEIRYVKTLLTEPAV